MQERVLAVGIDPAKRQHQAVGVLYPDRIVLELTVDNDVADVEQLDAKADELASHHEAEVVYGIEDHRGLGRRAVDVLQRRGREVRVVNPLSSNRQKQFYGEDKSDHVDARAIAAVVLRRREHLPDATDRDETITAIREAERSLQDLSKRRTKALSRLHEQLGAVHPPDYHRFFGKLTSPWALRFFRRFPVAQDLRDQDPGSLVVALEELAEGRIGPVPRRHAHQHLLNRAERIVEATAGLRRQPRTAALELKAELVRQLCDEILLLSDRIGRLEHMLAKKLLPRVEERVLTSLPGVGDVLAATITGEIGDVRRFRSRDAFAKYNGTAPAEHSSGGRVRHRSRRGCNRRLKRALWLAACAAVLHDDLAAEYYQRCRGRGMSRIDSLKRVGRRMSDIIYAMLRRGEPYERNRLIKGTAREKQKPETGGTASQGQKVNRLTGSRQRQTRQRAAADQPQSIPGRHAAGRRTGRRRKPRTP